ncbi:MAG: dTDP-glucose 4,6-dehydratase [Parcubacteria group bacterium Gr01-1014_18]|nr:MAG: dTDP-glucose 4,6-dehydratase [Parcubacteria group bacterium Greene0416_36]TSC80987.1 MAG: dTDP-glucose 4,6-dehydratase [Parcubacteria group bacterium Gr01-1014_18]TSC98874.1 MAG: dTDP-glucose 4,6-dehydratase [Parcubacteria group bacterium Greene1014_20]TSD06540.1 MAG: dTDP-glucose 4,6-dehydratase [Parcubacteria group bacterium Greene0714_2]
MNLLITGGAGFIGSNFIRTILAKYPEDSVMNLDLLTYAGNLENLKEIENNSRYKFVKGDITDRSLVDSLMKDTGAVVHFAAETHVDRSVLDSGNFVRSNILGTYTLLESARQHGGKRFHHVSTDEVFGVVEGKPFDENTPYNPRSPYSASKAASDHLVRAYFHTFNLPITISNCANNYGPYCFPEKLIPLAITNLIEGKKVPVYGDGLQVRDWLHVIDHCSAIDTILRKGKIGETYCVGVRKQLPNIEIVRLILKALGKDESFIEFVKDRPGHDRHYAIDPSRVERELGWKSAIAFEEGIAQTVKWYVENAEWWRKVKSGEYREYYERQYGHR